MARNLRILGVAACLLVLWMVVRGTNGCAMPDPYEVEVTLEGSSSYADGEVFFNGQKLENQNTPNVYKLNDKGKGRFKLRWYPFMRADKKLLGVLTIIIKKDDVTHHQHGEHCHVPFEVEKDVPEEPIDITQYPLAG